MSSVRVWFVTPGMDVHYDKVYCAFSPSATVGEVAQQLHAEWSEEEDDQQWVAFYNHELLNDTMTFSELKDRVPSGKKLKIFLVNRNEAQILVKNRKDNSRAMHDDAGTAKGG